MDNSAKNQLLNLPGAIIIAGALIAVAIIWVKQPAKTVVKPEANLQGILSPEINFRPISATDHIYGNPNAEIKIIEYSDTSCPYCKSFNPIMEKVIGEYGPGGKVAWIYRHYPLDKPDQNGQILHKNSGHEAEALECAAALGGNEKFWAYEKLLYETTPSVTGATPNGLDQKQLPIMAKNIGLDQAAFNDCLSSDRFKQKIEADFTDGQNAGVTGTPYSIIVTPTGTKIPMPGLTPYQTVKSAIDALLSQN